MKLIPLLEIKNSKLKWVGKFIKTPINPGYPLIVKDLNEIIKVKNSNKTYVILSKIKNKSYIVDYENTIIIRNKFNLKKELENKFIVRKNKGISIILTGRLKGAKKTTKFSIGEGKLKPLSFNFYLEYISDYILTKWGKYGLRIKIS